MFKKILIANRGEIACRIIRTARRMGIATVAVYSAADEDALHVRLADEAVAIGAAPATESYLNIKKIIAACRKTGADAIHPGYGFLSENAEFALALKKAGIVFIGPPVDAVRAMGDKITAKKLARKAGVNVVPGVLAAIRDENEAKKVARQVGYPLLVKAAAGGGGKGMRVVRRESELRDALRSAANEARGSFADDRVFIEKYIDNPRHIEIQILADKYGNIVHLGERECSIQRRHQKVIEEAPSPMLDAALRRRVGDQAVKLARAAQYVSVGTVEFIVDRDRNFYFMEMNTRLQVEHPVTEMVTGLDLVELMIRIAAGEKLKLRQSKIKLKGHAIEARLYAEDPARGFLPSIGRLSQFMAPEESKNVRVDTGVEEGGDISIYYDPMIAKLITHGKDREAALNAMQDALDGFYVRGVQHNADFLGALMAHPQIRRGNMSTHFLAEEFPGNFIGRDQSRAEAWQCMAVAVALHHEQIERQFAANGRLAAREQENGARYVICDAEKCLNCHIVPMPQGDFVTIGHLVFIVKRDTHLADPVWRGTVNNMPHIMQLDRRGAGYNLRRRGAVIDIEIYAPHMAPFAALMPKRDAVHGARQLLAPMPGLLTLIAVKQGQQVKAGQELAVVEAMKMENILRAERDGTVGKIHAKAGSSLTVDQIILEFE